MTKQQWKERLPVIQAWVEGKTIQFNNEENGWNDFSFDTGPAFQEELCKWRIKPEPREFWAKVFDDNGGRHSNGFLYTNKDTAIKSSEPNSQIIHVKEVL